MTAPGDPVVTERHRLLWPAPHGGLAGARRGLAEEKKNGEGVARQKQPVSKGWLEEPGTLGAYVQGIKSEGKDGRLEKLGLGFSAVLQGLASSCGR